MKDNNKKISDILRGFLRKSKIYRTENLTNIKSIVTFMILYRKCLRRFMMKSYDIFMEFLIEILRNWCVWYFKTKSYGEERKTQKWKEFDETYNLRYYNLWLC